MRPATWAWASSTTAYEDAELADTIVAVGTNALETQTNYFLNHWIPNLDGRSLGKKQEQLAGEPHAPARIVIVDPRRTVTVNACEAAAGADNVLHLAINSGTDLALFNALLTYIAEQGWLDRAFIDAHTRDFDQALAANRTSLEEAASITGLSADEIRTAAAWIAEPKEGARRRTMFGYEKGLIWGNDNYRTNAALVNLALATGNVGRPGGGCVRLGGHQEGYVRPSDAFIGRPAPYVDKLLIEGQGGVHHIWACDHYKTTLNADAFKRVYKERTDRVKDAINSVPAGDRAALVEAIMARDPRRRPVRRQCRHRADPDRRGLPRRAAGRDLGRDEPHLDERRAAHAPDRALHGPAGPGDARLPDRRAARQPPGSGVPRRRRRRERRQVPGLRLADRGRRVHGRLPPARRWWRVRDLRAPARDGHQRLPGARGRASRTARSSALKRLYTDGSLRQRGRPGDLHGGAVARPAGAGQGAGAGDASRS